MPCRESSETGTSPAAPQRKRRMYGTSLRMLMRRRWILTHGIAVGSGKFSRMLSEPLLPLFWPLIPLALRGLSVLFLVFSACADIEGLHRCVIMYQECGWVQSEKTSRDGGVSFGTLLQRDQRSALKNHGFPGLRKAFLSQEIPGHDFHRTFCLCHKA